MRQFDTSMGGPQAAFPSTLWSELLDSNESDRRARFDHLAQTYWKPVYVYIRTAWRKSNEDAKDLTQAFFAQMMEKGYVHRVRPECGSFRGYLKTALRHFLINAEEHAAIRRPKGFLLHLEARPEEWAGLGPISQEESPEAAYDREWFQELLESATQTLKDRLTGEKKEPYFAVFRRYCLEGDGGTYREVGLNLGLTESDVRHRLEYVRSLFRRILRERIREYVSTTEEIEPELRKVLSD